MKTTKRIFGILLTLCMLVGTISVLSPTAFAANEAKIVPSGLSTGAIVAIVMACVVVLADGGFALYWFVFKKKKEDV